MVNHDNRRLKVLHIITNLYLGGAESMLCRLICAMDRDRFSNEVISLIGVGSVADKVRSAGVPVRSLGMKRGVANPLVIPRLVRWVRDSKPQIVQTWMYHANLIGALAARLAGDVPIVWGIHQADLDRELNKPVTLGTSRCCAYLSRWLPVSVVFVSQAAMLLHTRHGYAAQRMVVVPNGFDLQAFKPDPAARLSLRKELQLPESTQLIGMAARFHPQKGHVNFIQAAAQLHAVMPDVHFCLCGRGVTRDNPELMKRITLACLQERFHLLDERSDIASFYAAIDIATSSSRSEAFPLSVGEAMACGTPCVVTDVGDSARIVGDTGSVVPPNDPRALASAWRELIEAGAATRRDLGMAARSRVRQHFSLNAVVRRYESIYEELAGATPRAVRTSCDPRDHPHGAERGAERSRDPHLI
jgi:glycosyltransferase involved in cell wall biosynthesis